MMLMEHKTKSTAKVTAVRIPAGGMVLDADLAIPENAQAIIVFAHGSGSGRHSPRNRYVAEILNRRGFATLMADLLTEDEELADNMTRRLRFDISLLAGRLGSIIGWLALNDSTKNLGIGLFGASTGAGAALIAAAKQPGRVRAVVSRGGRPDLAGEYLGNVMAPTLLIVGSLDTGVILLNEDALSHLVAPASMEIVDGATHLFEERGTLDQVAELAARWFEKYRGKDHGHGV
jgi:dienelactone hydrolase